MTIGDDGIATRDNTGESWKRKESGEMQKTAPSLSESRIVKDSSLSADEITADRIAWTDDRHEQEGLIIMALRAARDSERARIRAAILSRAREVRKGASFLNQSFRLADILSFIDADPITQVGASASAPAQNVESQVSVSALPSGSGSESSGSEIQKKLIEALQRIERWFGEFPDTGRFWDEPKNTEPMSYSACFGTNGERDYMRQIAREALSLLNGEVK